ncbi:alpha-L-fucosidase [Ancylomarina sp. 16SWW S1-10-2]|nr:alpha-L-fucosidase [Ancylomarina sp. 16SWW S1-10-2]
MQMKNILKTSLMFVIYIAMVSVFVQCNNTANKSKQENHTPIIPPEPRLQMDIAEGSADLQWWRDAQATREQRIEAWRDARFGCFIHWGASSVLGSSWKGKAYGGYGEHIQRMAKIPCEEYREKVVGSFNPIKFDADEWARIIKAAGMKYVIITAKHHDGFAMFDSDASDYNVVDATPFGRDPMAELKAACDKNGLKFGFYYSHAFDWGEPNGSGNDWDYENPGGDRHLFTEKDAKWFDVHPEIAPRIRTYVDEKSIPQVVELVNKYDPDFLWFDTPHKLPPEENLRILKAARTAKPSIVINSRVVSGYDGIPAPGHFGDYASTGDRAVDFPTKEGDWEAIPTTNESYGYNANDDSHKTPEFLVQVLVKAVARGGNMLLNIGPKGDGEIDAIDVDILKGIGKWMDVNETSIRGTERTTLPVQAWGESTRKKNTFYLQVFDWPTNGVLQLGGGLGKVNKAYLLSDKNQTALSHKRTDKRTLQFEVPVEALDLASSVIVVDVDDAENVDSHRLISTNQNNMLRAFDGIAVGGKFKYGNGKITNNGVSSWKDNNQAMTWPVYLTEACKFNVVAEYKRSKQSNKFIVEAGNTTLSGITQSDERRSRDKDYIKQELGSVSLSSGNQMIKIHADSIPEGDLMELRALHLIPLSGE